MPLITQAQSRKERRKQERQKRKQYHGRQQQVAMEEEEEQIPTLKKMKTNDGKTKTSKEKAIKKDARYGHLDPDAAAAMHRDDEEIADLEMKLGLSKKKDKAKLHKEYAKLEGFGDDFGEFLDDLDDIALRVSKSGDHDLSGGKEAKKQNIKGKKHKKTDQYSDMEPDLVAAIRRDEEEIAELEHKLGLGKKKDKAKLYNQYSKEGYGEKFGEFLDDLDDVINRVTNHHTDPRDEGMSDQEDEYYQSEGSDKEEFVPMKEPFEEMDEDDSVLEELEREENEQDDDGEEDEQEEGESTSSRDEGDETVLKPSVNQERDENDDEQEDEISESGGPGEDASGSEESDSSADDSNGDREEEPDHDIADTYNPAEGEDIYGNKMNAGGSGGAKPTKYVPPHLRKSQNVDDEDQKERLRLIQRSLNNALNRLSEDTLVSVAQPVAKLYSSNPTGMVNEMLWKNTKGACVAPPMLMTGLIPIYAACVVGVHIQTGDTVQVGEYMLEQVVTELMGGLVTARKKNLSGGDLGDGSNEVENKHTCNLMLILCYLYNYSIVHCSFMYDIIRHLIEEFCEIDIECLLLLLSHCGRSLRSDDPLALKEIVLLVQKKKAENSKSISSSRVEYMVLAIMDLKNNKRRKHDTVFSDRVSKLRKLLGRIKSTAAKSSNSKTSSEASLRITLQDILDAETKGRWWKVGASWVGNQYRFSDEGSNEEKKKDVRGSATENPEQDEEVIRLASKFRMNTDRKRAIFCIIMGGTDCEDVFEKLCRGSMLQNRSERDTVRVLMECCGNEKSYNKFYGHLAARLCEYQPQCKFSLQLAYWDSFKQLEKMDPRKVANLAKLLFHLVVTHRALKLMSVLKALDISADTDDMEETTMIFLTILMSSILDCYDDPSQVKALVGTHRTMEADSSKEDQEEAIRPSLLVFFVETLKKSPKNKKGSRFRKNFKAAVQALDTDGFGDMF